MVKLVGVYQGSGTKTRTSECKSRRFLPLEIEPDLTLVMALEEFCLACGTDRLGQSKSKQPEDVQALIKNYNSLDKDELSAALMVTWADMVSSVSQTISCVGCRRSVENLFHTLKESSDDCSIDPLLITKDGVMSINSQHMTDPTALANLLCHQVNRLYRQYIDGPSIKKSGVKKGGRCAHHTLDQKKGVSGSWLDCWDVMESECKEEVVLLPFTAIRATLDKYLKKHSFCCECATMINKAFTYLIEEGKDPAKGREEDSDSSNDDDDSDDDSCKFDDTDYTKLETQQIDEGCKDDDSDSSNDDSKVDDDSCKQNDDSCKYDDAVSCPVKEGDEEDSVVSDFSFSVSEPEEDCACCEKDVTASHHKKEMKKLKSFNSKEGKKKSQGCDESEDLEMKTCDDCETGKSVDTAAIDTNDDGSLNLFSGVSPCVSDAHVHISCNPTFISQLLLLAEPEISGLDQQERHAKNMETAQKEVLTCIGITLFNRFHKIQQRLREGEQTCDLLCLVALISLRKSLEISVESKRGTLDLDALCYQIEQSDRDRERKQARKREKKVKQQQKRKDLKVKLKEMTENQASCDDISKVPTGQKQLNCDVVGEAEEKHTCSPTSKSQNDAPNVKTVKSGKDRKKKKNTVKSEDSKTATGEEHEHGGDSDSGLSCVWSGDTSPLYARGEGRFEHGNWIKGGSPDLGLGEGGEAGAAAAAAKHSCHPANAKPAGGNVDVHGNNGRTAQDPSVVPSLEDLLEEPEDPEVEDDEEEMIYISQEEMIQFQKMFPQLNKKREQLRENLREKFAALCVKGSNSTQ